MSLECAHLGLVARSRHMHMQHISGQHWKLLFLPSNSCSVFVSDTCGVRVPICKPILCVLTPGLSLPCSAKRWRAEARKQGRGGRIWGWDVRFKADVEVVERHKALL
jgi:hypothetical protein